MSDSMAHPKPDVHLDRDPDPNSSRMPSPSPTLDRNTNTSPDLVQALSKPKAWDAEFANGGFLALYIIEKIAMLLWFLLAVKAVCVATSERVYSKECLAPRVGRRKEHTRAHSAEISF